jgi:hypothetical protein
MGWIFKGHGAGGGLVQGERCVHYRMRSDFCCGLNRALPEGGARFLFGMNFWLSFPNAFMGNPVFAGSVPDKTIRERQLKSQPTYLKVH